MVGGGKSQSSSTTDSTSVQQTVNPSVSGLVTGDNIQGQSVTINGLASQDIGAAISALINLTSHTIDAAAEATGAALQTNAKITTDVAAPVQSTIDKAFPIIALAAVAYAATKVIK